MRDTETCFDRAGTECRPFVMGRRLEVFTLGHARVLFAMRSPFVDAVSRAPETSDYIAAVYVCSMPWRQALQRVQDPARVTVECRRWNCSHADLLAGMDAISAFIRESCQWPEPLKRSGEKAHDAGLPWPWLVAWAVSKRISEPWDLSSVEAISWYACTAAENGTEFMTDELRNAADAIVVTKNEEIHVNG